MGLKICNFKEKQYGEDGKHSGSLCYFKAGVGSCDGENNCVFFQLYLKIVNGGQYENKRSVQS